MQLSEFSMLDLNDRAMFMESGLVPLSGHWCVVGEIKQTEMFARLRLDVIDKNSEVPNKPFIIAFYVDNTPEMDGHVHRLWRLCRPGNTIFLLDPRPHTFLDGTWGFRIEDPETVMVSMTERWKKTMSDAL